MNEEQVLPKWISSCIASYDKIMSSDLGQCVISSMKVGDYRETRFEEFRINTLNGHFKTIGEWTNALINMIDQIVRDFGRNNEICSGLLTIKQQIEEVFEVSTGSERPLKEVLNELTDELNKLIEELPDNLDEYNQTMEKNSKALNPFTPDYHPYKFPEPIDSTQARQLYFAIKNIKSDEEHAKIGQIIRNFDPIYSKEKDIIKFNILSNKNNQQALSFLYDYLGLEKPNSAIKDVTKEELKEN